MPESSELQSLRDSAVFIDGDGHDVLCATGNDRASFLHRITSGKVAGIAPGQGGRTLLLDVRGRVLASLLAFVRGKSVRLIVPGGQGAEIAAGLSKYAIMDDFQVVAEAELASIAILGPSAAHALDAMGIAVPLTFLESPLFAHVDCASEAFGPVWVAHGRRCGMDGLCLVVSRAGRDEIVRALMAAGTPRLPPDIAEGARIAALEPAPGKEITPERFPVEIGLGSAIDHQKGCYVGQETIVRMRDRGIIRKRLTLLRVSAAAMPSPGDKIAADGQPAAGVVTSSGRLDGAPPLALAILANVVAVGASVTIGHEGMELPAEVAAESPPWG